jgi:hypothetical protein
MSADPHFAGNGHGDVSAVGDKSASEPRVKDRYGKCDAPVMSQLIFQIINAGRGKLLVTWNAKRQRLQLGAAWRRMMPFISGNHVIGIGPCRFKAHSFTVQQRHGDGEPRAFIWKVVMTLAIPVKKLFREILIGALEVQIMLIRRQSRICDAGPARTLIFLDGRQMRRQVRRACGGRRGIRHARRQVWRRDMINGDAQRICRSVNNVQCALGNRVPERYAVIHRLAQLADRNSQICGEFRARRLGNSKKLLQTVVAAEPKRIERVLIARERRNLIDVNNNLNLTRSRF